MKVDLHIHTIASDGSWTPAELVGQVRAAGIGLFAVTDHDSVGSLAATARLAREAGLEFIPGVEICSTLGGRQFHILGYGIDPDAWPLTCLLAGNTQLMEQTDDESIRQLVRQGLPVDFQEYRDYRRDPARGGWKSLSYLIDKGLCANVEEFFAKLFTADRRIAFPDFPPPRQVIAAIHAAGGKAVLAHPASEFHGTLLEETLDCFAREAIDGVECFHPSHNAADSVQASEWCKRRGLLITGGSDCHGAFVPERRLGEPALQLKQLRLGTLLEAINL